MHEEQAIDKALAAHSSSLKEIWRLIRTIQRDPSLSLSEKDLSLSALYEVLSYKDIKQHFVMDGIKHDIGVSFRSSMANMMRVKRRLKDIDHSIAPGGNDKQADLAFAEHFGVPTPKTYSKNVPTASLALEPGTIIKPTSGANSRGVFLVNGDRSLFSIKTQEVYPTLDEASAELASPLDRTRWIVEQAILDKHGVLARDMKIYMFYGFPGLFIEIERGTGSGGRSRYATYNHEQKPVVVNNRYEMMEGSGVPSDVLPYAETLSLNSPVPFLRLDFLSGTTGSYLGEITPHPGDTYAGDLRDQVDRKLGEYFLEAEARLFADLLAGKQFDAYLSIYSSLPRK